MLTYPFCDQTVTVYRQEGDILHREVVEGCFYRWEDTLQSSDTGGRFARKCLLIQPGDTQKVFPGDRVYPGIGPENVDWENFLPVNTPGLSQIAYATPWYWEGHISHTEAGRK